MSEITIPPEALWAAARAVCETENGPCDVDPSICDCTYWNAAATAAIRAALAAWPGVSTRLADSVNVEPRVRQLILPLLQEKTDE